MFWRRMWATALGVLVGLVTFTLIASGFNDAQDDYHLSLPVESRVDQALSDTERLERQLEDATQGLTPSEPDCFDEGSGDTDCDGIPDSEDPNLLVP